MNELIKSLEQEQLKNEVPAFGPGDTVRVHVKIVEGKRERVQVFEGVVMKRQGGGAGMLMTPQPIYDTYKHIVETHNIENPRVVYLTPKGQVYKQEIASDLALGEDIILLCGHYEGIDQRIIDLIVTDEVSIGDYVLTGGELPALIMIDSISRLIPGVLSQNESFEEESFKDDLLEYPHYTRPREFMGMKVPDVLLSGNHQNIEKWRLEESKKITKLRRPDLYKKSCKK